MKNVVGAPGARLLRKVAKHILAEPLRYDQNEVICYGKSGEEYQVSDYDTGKIHPYPECGTVACIGGWLNILTSSKKPSSSTGLPMRKLARMLGVTGKQFELLTAYVPSGSDGSLWDSEWPIRFATAYNKAKSPLQKAKVANARIEHFIRTGE